MGCTTQDSTEGSEAGVLVLPLLRECFLAGQRGCGSRGFPSTAFWHSFSRLLGIETVLQQSAFWIQACGPLPRWRYTWISMIPGVAYEELHSWLYSGDQARAQCPSHSRAVSSTPIPYYFIPSCPRHSQLRVSPVELLRKQCYHEDHVLWAQNNYVRNQ